MVWLFRLPHYFHIIRFCSHFYETWLKTIIIVFIVRIPNLPGSHTTITIGSQTIECDSAHLEVIEELGRGAYGVVEKMRHTPSGTIMAVKVSKCLVQSAVVKFCLIYLAPCPSSLYNESV